MENTWGCYIMGSWHTSISCKIISIQKSEDRYNKNLLAYLYFVCSLNKRKPKYREEIHLSDLIITRLSHLPMSGIWPQCTNVPAWHITGIYRDGKRQSVHFYWSGGISNIFYWTKIFLTSHDPRTGVFWVGCYTQVPNFLKK